MSPTDIICIHLHFPRLALGTPGSNTSYCNSSSYASLLTSIIDCSFCCICHLTNIFATFTAAVTYKTCPESNLYFFVVSSQPILVQGGFLLDYGLYSRQSGDLSSISRSEILSWELKPPELRPPSPQSPPMKPLTKENVLEMQPNTMLSAKDEIQGSTQLGMNV